MGSCTAQCKKSAVLSRNCCERVTQFELVHLKKTTRKERRKKKSIWLFGNFLVWYICVAFSGYFRVLLVMKTHIELLFPKQATQCEKDEPRQGNFCSIKFNVKVRYVLYYKMNAY